MYLFFDHNGTLLETVSTTALRQNNIGVNKIYVHIQDEERPDSGKISESITGLTHRYKKTTGEIVYGTSVTRPADGTPYKNDIFENKQLPFNKKRDLKHFVYGRDYEFFVLQIPSGLTHIIEEDGKQIGLTEATIFDIAGPVLATISATDSTGGSKSLERIAFTIEQNGNIGETPISTSQFIWLLNEIIGIDNKVQSTRNYDTLTNRPIVNQDINASGFTPVAKTYYRDTNSGHLYFYDGKKLILINNLVAKDRTEFDAMVVSANLGQTISYNGNLYLIIDNNGIEARKIFNLNNIRLIDIRYGEIDRVDAMNDGIVWENVVAFGDDYSTEASALTRFRVPIVAGNHISFTGEGSTLKINADGVDDIKAIDTWNGDVSELYTDKNGITWTNGYAFLDESEEKTYGTGKIYNRIPIVQGNNVTFAPTGDGKAVAINVKLPETTLNGEKVTNPSFYAPTSGGMADGVNILVANGNGKAPIWGKLEIENKSEDDGLRSIFKLNGVVFGEVKHTQEIYLDSVVRDGNKIVFSYNTASGKKQVEVDLADLVDVYEAGNGLKRDGNTFSVKIEPNSTEFLEATADGIVFKKSALPEAGDKVEMLEGATINLASLPPEIGVIADSGIHYFVPEVELELPDGRFVYMQSRNAIPITAGEGVEFKKNDNNTVSINAKGGGNKIVATSAELDEAVAKEKEGTLISYVGESTSGGAVGTPFEVGDDFTGIYFNTNEMFDFEKVDYSSQTTYGVPLIGLNYGESLAYITCAYRVDLSAITSGVFSGYVYILYYMLGGTKEICYWSNDVTPQQLAEKGLTLPIAEWGWNYAEYADLLSNGMDISSEITPENKFVVSQSDYPELWNNIFSATPFVEGGSGYKKDTLYMVTDNGAKEIGGETIKFKSEDKGKFLVVGEDGSIVAESMTIGESMLI